MGWKYMQKKFNQNDFHIHIKFFLKSKVVPNKRKKLLQKIENCQSQWYECCSKTYTKNSNLSSRNNLICFFYLHCL